MDLDPKHCIRRSSGMGTCPELTSSRIWGIEWSKYFPYSMDQCCSNAIADVSTYEIVADFLAENFESIYQIEDGNSPFISTSPDPRITVAREKFYREMADLFCFRVDGKVVGVFVGNAVDWSTYYLRNVSILQSHQGNGLFPNFCS